CPILDGVIAWVDCEIEQIVESGDHYIVIGRVRDLDIVKSVTPLAFFKGKFSQVFLPDESANRELTSYKAEQIAALFADHSPRHQKAKEIAELAGVNAQHYDEMIKPNGDIIKEILLEYLNTMLVRYRSAIAVASGSSEALQQLIKAMFSSIEDHRAATVLFQNERAALADNGDLELTNIERMMRHLWEETIKQGITSGEFRSDHEPRIVYSMIRDAVFVVARWYKSEGTYSVEELASNYTDHILNGMKS